jgi:hypothetical protein
MVEALPYRRFIAEGGSPWPTGLKSEIDACDPLKEAGRQ